MSNYEFGEMALQLRALAAILEDQHTHGGSQLSGTPIPGSQLSVRTQDMQGNI